MQWQEVINNPILQDLPFKLETNEWGQIIMNAAASNQHSVLQMKIASRLEKLSSDDQVLVECSIETKKGVKVSDVAWASRDFLNQYFYETPYLIAPEICVEVVSPSNTKGEMNEKRELYLEAGAQEVWFCDEEGNVEFWVEGGKVEQSTMFPTFPNKIELLRRN